MHAPLKMRDPLKGSDLLSGFRESSNSQKARAAFSRRPRGIEPKAFVASIRGFAAVFVPDSLDERFFSHFTNSRF
jgi:hypothetical protein